MPLELRNRPGAVGCRKGQCDPGDNPMNRTFLFAAIVLFATHVTAANIQLEFESRFHFTDWQLATRDRANNLITINTLARKNFGGR
jgi:hypothetical protein